jgi:hypothetical protein
MFNILSLESWPGQQQPKKKENRENLRWLEAGSSPAMAGEVKIGTVSCLFFLQYWGLNSELCPWSLFFFVTLPPHSLQ